MQFTISVAAAMAMFASGALAQARIIMEEMMVPASDAGIEIGYLRRVGILFFGELNRSAALVGCCQQHHQVFGLRLIIKRLTQVGNRRVHLPLFQAELGLQFESI